MNKFYIALLCLATALHGFSASAGQHIVVSSPPIHSIIAAIAGKPSPALPVSGKASFHHAALKPSARRIIDGADIFFYGDPAIEPLAAAVLPSLPASVTRAPLRDAPGVTGDNPHIWMTPDNAAAIAAAALDALIARYPENAAKYRKRHAKFLAKLATLDEEITDMLAPVAEKPFIVYHDAYSGFAENYGLHMIGYAVKNPDMPLGARRMRKIRRLIAKRAPVCLFAEKGEGDLSSAALAEGYPTRVALLNPDGAGMEPGPGLYFRLMRNMAKDMRECLDGQDRP